MSGGQLYKSIAETLVTPSPCCAELNPVESVGRLLKARVTHWLCPSLGRVVGPPSPGKGADLFHRWLTDRVNSGTPR